MRHKLAFLTLCWGCAQTAPHPRAAPEMPPSAPAPDSLNSVARAKIVDAIAYFRQTAFSSDTTRLDGCSVALAVGPDYRALIRADFLPLLSQPTTPCGKTPDLTGYARRLVLLRIVGEGKDATALIAYLAAPYTHNEDYKLRSVLAGPAQHWVVTEMRVHGIMIVD